MPLLLRDRLRLPLREHVTLPVLLKVATLLPLPVALLVIVTEGEGGALPLAD